MLVNNNHNTNYSTSYQPPAATATAPAASAAAPAAAATVAFQPRHGTSVGSAPVVHHHATTAVRRLSSSTSSSSDDRRQSTTVPATASAVRPLSIRNSQISYRRAGRKRSADDDSSTSHQMVALMLENSKLEMQARRDELQLQLEWRREERLATER